MEPLNTNYKKELATIAKAIQASDELKVYLEEEEDDAFKAMQEKFEPEIAKLHELVAVENPLQLVAFEREMLEAEIEGLFLPRVLGYSVLRGQVNSNYKFYRPQDHFKDILLNICNSMNFDILKNRIGQAVQFGFCLSSDIWITNLMNQIVNKRVQAYLDSQRLDKYRDLPNRERGYLRFKKQFQHFHYHTTEFPGTAGELKVLFHSVYNFIIHRVKKGQSHDSYISSIVELLKNESLWNEIEFVKIAVLIAHHIQLPKENAGILTQVFDHLRKNREEFGDDYFRILKMMHESALGVSPKADLQFSQVIDKEINDDLSPYYKLMEVLHEKGFAHEESIEKVNNFYNQHEGLSIVNDCVRLTLLNYFKNILEQLGESEYPEYFEINKVFVEYMGIFANQQFNQYLKQSSLDYVKKLLKHFTDKRGRDYQDIKRFVSIHYLDMGFLKEKEVVELFKTRRKRKASA